MARLKDLGSRSDRDSAFLEASRDLGRLSRPMYMKNSHIAFDPEEVRRISNLDLDEIAQWFIGLDREK